MDLHHLRIFVAIYNKRSFSLASRDLNISQPTISEHIKNLEAELGVSLFDRLPRTIIPTKAADAIYTKAVHILEEAGTIIDAVRSSSDRVSGQLKVGSSTIPGTYIIPRIAGSFRKKYPDVSFNVFIGGSQDITEKLLNHEIVLGITGALTDRSSLSYIPFASDPLLLAAPPGFVKETKISRDKFASIPIVIREEGSGTRKATEEQLTALGMNPQDLNVSGIIGSSSSIKQAVISGLGASIFSKLSIAKELKDGILKEIKVEGLEMKRSFYAVMHRRRQLSPPYNQFLDSLLSIED
ncbi:selenium metabolism-associated LysR family transcriptional regulator [Nitrospirota bacterium]